MVASITEKLKNQKKADLDKDGKLSGYEKKRGAAIEKSMANQNESVDEINEEEEEELEERKKRDTPRDSDRREADKLKISEDVEELDEGEEEQLEETQEETVEETTSNDEWYQSELFESLKKRWTK